MAKTTDDVPVVRRTSGADNAAETVSEIGCQQCVRKFIKFLKIFITFLFSHVGLTCVVFGYTILGGILFQSIELPEERQTREDVVIAKDACVDEIVAFYESSNIEAVLDKRNWNSHMEAILRVYRKKLYQFTKERDWGGQFEGDEYQWSFTESLLYSVTVISTIGYGNITPKTKTGRLLTILYGIGGIPLTMLCLRNIGNLMAGCFRFIYRCACVNMTYQYIKLKRRRLRQKFTKRLNGKTKELKKWAKKKQSLVTSQVSSILHHSHTDLHSSNDHISLQNGRGIEQLSEHSNRVDSEPIMQRSTRRHSHHVVRHVDKMTPVRKLSLSARPHDSVSSHCSTIHDLSVIPEDELVEVTFDDVKNYQTIDQNDQDCKSATTMSSISLRDFDQDEVILKARLRDTRDLVPISVCLLLVTGYIILGAMIFASWEESWNFLVGFYFCFITLTTTGFGDFVPGMGRLDNDERLVFCVVYLLLGMALIAMSFHLIQEEVRHKCTKLARRIGLVEEKITQMLDQYTE